MRRPTGPTARPRLHPARRRRLRSPSGEATRRGGASLPPGLRPWWNPRPPQAATTGGRSGGGQVPRSQPQTGGHGGPPVGARGTAHWSSAVSFEGARGTAKNFLLRGTRYVIRRVTTFYALYARNALRSGPKIGQRGRAAEQQRAKAAEIWRKRRNTKLTLPDIKPQTLVWCNNINQLCEVLSPRAWCRSTGRRRPPASGRLWRRTQSTRAVRDHAPAGERGGRRAASGHASGGVEPCGTGGSPPGTVTYGRNVQAHTRGAPMEAPEPTVRGDRRCESISALPS